MLVRRLGKLKVGDRYPSLKQVCFLWICSVNIIIIFLRLPASKQKDSTMLLLIYINIVWHFNQDAPSALYEISQFYLYLKQVPQGQEALEKAVENDPQNYWYSQGLSNLYQQQGQKEKAINLLEDMCQRFPERENPCSIWSICIIKQKIIRMSFIRSTGLSKSLVRMNSSAWRSSASISKWKMIRKLFKK